jgi:hypothetical protein
VLRRLLSWCLRRRATDDGAAESGPIDVARALAPYRDEPAPPILRLADPIAD